MSDKPSRDGRPSFYAMMLPKAIAAARECGYALGVHGSMVSDLDIIAVPWVEEAKSDEELAEAIAVAVHASVSRHGASMVNGQWVNRTDFPKISPHGRHVWTLNFMGDVYIDLSVMPRKPFGAAP